MTGGYMPSLTLNQKPFTWLTLKERPAKRSSPHLGRRWDSLSCFDARMELDRTSASGLCCAPRGSNRLAHNLQSALVFNGFGRIAQGRDHNAERGHRQTDSNTKREHA
jgi:hypothetical protein